MTSENNYDIKSLTTPAATGGTITTSGDHRIHTFTSSGTFVANKAMNVEYLAVAGGGGGGGGGYGGGGGAGGYIYNSSLNVQNQTYTITVGSGGIGGSPDTSYSGQNGGDSSFSTITVYGGGRGATANSGVAGANGGSGGGGQGPGSAQDWSGTWQGGIGSQGHNGGTGHGIKYSGSAGGGGGGSYSNGVNAVGGSYGGNGGDGTSNSISGSAVTYAGGGGGGSSTGSQGIGGIGGGGNGSNGTVGMGTDGTANTGGGGGAIHNGGSGIVIISYLLSEDILTPANIGAISMTVAPPSESPCRAGICTVDVSVTWKNTGESSGSSNLSITVSGGTSTITQPSYSSVAFAANQEITRTFTVSNMTAGTHTICPNPN